MAFDKMGKVFMWSVRASALALGFCLVACGYLPAQEEFRQENRSSSQEQLLHIQQLYRSAHSAAQAEDYVRAIQLYQSIISLDAENLLEARSFYDIQWRLASAYSQAGRQQEAEVLVDTLRQHPLPSHLFLRNELLAARIYKETERLENAYSTLYKLEEEIGAHEWSPEDRALKTSIEKLLDSSNESLLLRGEQYFDGGAITEAIPYYSRVLFAIESTLYPASLKRDSDIEIKVRYRLAQALYLEEKYEEAISILDKLSELHPEKHSHLRDLYHGTLYLKGLTLRHHGYYEKALESFLSYIFVESSHPLPHLLESQWNIGYCYYKLGEHAKAKKHLSYLEHMERPSRLYNLSQLTLAYIELDQGSLESVESLLSPLESELPPYDPLRYETAYIRGEAHYRLRHYEKAAHYLEAAIPERNKRKASWYPGTLYNLGWSYLKLADGDEGSLTTRAHYFALAENTFKNLMTFRPDERLYLALAKVYLARGHRLQDPEAFAAVEQLLSHEVTFSITDHFAEALLLRAEAAENYASRQALYEQLTESVRLSSTTSHEYGWYYRGINEFEEIKRLQYHNLLNEGEARELYLKACTSLQKAFESLRKKAPAKAGLALKFKAEALFNLGTDRDLREGLQTCHQLISTKDSVFSKMEEPDEVLYLQGLIASRLVSDTEGEFFDSLAKQSLQRVVENYHEGNFAASSLNLLATLYFHQQNYESAESLFLQLATYYPNSSYAGEAWFWASECADWQHKDPHEVREFRRHAFEKYPNSPHADSAYFNYYSYSEYLQGSADALDHLQQMEKRYPDSPLLTVAHYLIGLDLKRDRPTLEASHKKDLVAANDHFDEAVKTFDFCYNSGLIKENSLEYFITVRYRSLLERAGVNLSIAEQSTAAKRHIYLEYAEALYSDVVYDFETDGHSLTRYLIAGENLPRILEESLYGLAQTYHQAGKDELAKDILTKSLKRYETANVQRGYFLSRFLYQAGCVALDSQEIDQAFAYFNSAESAADGRVLNTDERLDLWIQQSLCLKSLGRVDESMLMLSKVINEDAASHQRIKAMYLRAELYEARQRSDLAVKQLEATASKAGEWALKAKEKLEKEYGYN